VGGAFYESVTPKVKTMQVKKPAWVGNVKIGEKGRAIGLEECEGGFLSCWEVPVLDGSLGPKFRDGEYVMGMDVAFGGKGVGGRGSSNSVIALGRVEEDRVVKVAQYMTSGLMAHLFANIASAIGWMALTESRIPAYAIWESNGPGQYFGPALMNTCCYPHYYQEVTSVNNVTPGFYMGQSRQANGMLAGSRVNVFHEHLKWLSDDRYEEPSFDTFREMEQYKNTSDGGCEHVAVKSALDPGHGSQNHGDSVIATVLMVWGARRLMENRSTKRIEVVYPRGSLGHLQQKHKRQKAGLWR
jgi:hypothetical protein